MVKYHERSNVICPSFRSRREILHYRIRISQVSTQKLHYRFLLFMFELSQKDLIRGVRANKHNEDAFINAALLDIRKEIQKKDIDIKSNAVAKLLYVSA